MIKKEADFTLENQIYFEHSVEIDGYSYLIIFGHHINGGFIAIPNHKISCEASSDADVIYNTAKLHEAGLEKNISKAIANYINCNFNKRPLSMKENILKIRSSELKIIFDFLLDKVEECYQNECKNLVKKYLQDK
ncbi:MAG: DUF6618 family protein [Thomasclavelia ramosa]